MGHCFAKLSSALPSRLLIFATFLTRDPSLLPFPSASLSLQTYVGDIICAVNPYKELKIYDKTVSWLGTLQWCCSVCGCVCGSVLEGCWQH